MGNLLTFIGTTVYGITGNLKNSLKHLAFAFFGYIGPNVAVSTNENEEKDELEEEWDDGWRDIREEDFFNEDGVDYSTETDSERSYRLRQLEYERVYDEYVYGLIAEGGVNRDAQRI